MMAWMHEKQEPLEFEAEGRLLHGFISFRQVDKFMWSYSVSYAGLLHRSSSRYAGSERDMMRLHGRFDLQDLVTRSSGS